MDIDYYPPPGTDTDPATLPAVVIVSGYPDDGFRKHTGTSFREMESTVAWARRFGASGMVGVTYSTNDPAAGIHEVLRELHGRRIAIWASSGNVPVALSALMHDAPEPIACAALCYGYTLDVAEAAATFKFANPTAGRTIDDLRSDVPLFLARAGQDQFPGLNEALDRFVAGALRRNLPLTLVNHPDGPHAFDLADDSATTREIIRGIVAFLQFHLALSHPSPRLRGEGAEGG